jgi:predicted methyltransferase
MTYSKRVREHLMASNRVPPDEVENICRGLAAQGFLKILPSRTLITQKGKEFLSSEEIMDLKELGRLLRNETL